MGLAKPEMAELLFLEGNHFLPLIEDPSIVCAGVWAESFKPSQDRGTDPFTTEDLLGGSDAQDGSYTMIGYADGWTVIRFAGGYVLEGSVVPQLLAARLKSRAFYVCETATGPASIKLVQEDGALLRAIEGNDGSTAPGSYAFIGEPLPMEAELSSFTTLRNALNLFEKWGGPNWVNQSNAPARLEKTRHYVVTASAQDWLGGDSEAAKTLLAENETRWTKRSTHPSAVETFPIEEDLETEDTLEDEDTVATPSPTASFEEARPPPSSEPRLFRGWKEQTLILGASLAFFAAVYLVRLVFQAFDS